MNTAVMERHFTARKMITYFINSLFLSMTVLFFAPLEVILINAQEFHFTFRNIWLLQLGVSVVCAIVFTGIEAILPQKAGLILAALMTAIGMAAWIQMMFLNGKMILLTGEEMTVPMSTKVINAAIWAVIIIGVTAAVYLAEKKHPKKGQLMLGILGGALTVMQGVAMITLIATADPVENRNSYLLSREEAFDFSPNTNVIEIILDTADREYADKMLAKYPELQESLSGWVYYPNAVSTYSRTYPALTYLLSGEKCQFDRKPNEYVEEAFQKSSFLKTMKERGTDIAVYTGDPEMIGSEGMQFITNSIHKGEATEHFVYPQLEKNLARISLYKCMPYLLKNLFRYQTEIINISSFDYEPYQQWMDPAFYDFLRANDGATISEDKKSSFKLYHLYSTHPGAYWDSNLKQTDNLKDEDILRGSFRVIERLDDDLKEAGIFDKALIIVTADHGSSNGDRVRFERNRASCPLLMVKYPESDTSRPLALNNAPVAHDDLFRTIHAALGCEDGKNYGSGKALAEFEEGEERIRYHYYTAIDEDTREVALIEYKIDGDAYNFRNWKKTGAYWDVMYSTNPVSEKRIQEE